MHVCFWKFKIIVDLRDDIFLALKIDVHNMHRNVLKFKMGILYLKKRETKIIPIYTKYDVRGFVHIYFNVHA